MPRFLNPQGLPRSSGQESGGVLLRAAFKRLIAPPQTGALADGNFSPDLETQLALAFDNVLALLAAAGMDVGDLVRVVIHSTVPGAAETCVRVRDARIAPARPAYAYREVGGLADPGCLVDIEVEAVRES